MIDAKSELLQHIMHIRTVYNTYIKCAEVTLVTEDDFLETHYLPLNFTEKELNDFYEIFNFAYMNVVEFETDLVITGVIWWVDGSWSERGMDSDFEESWFHCRVPTIPKILKRPNKNNVVSLF
jgi:hypothetical protein